MLRVLFHAGGVSWPIRPSPPRIRTPRSPERHRSSPTNTVYAPADPDAPVTAPVTPIVTPWPPPRSRPGDGRPQWAWCRPAGQLLASHSGSWGRLDRGELPDDGPVRGVQSVRCDLQWADRHGAPSL